MLHRNSGVKRILLGDGDREGGRGRGWTGGLVFGLVSVTWMVTVVVPAAFGVPVICPDEESFSPLGSFEPVASFHL